MIVYKSRADMSNKSVVPLVKIGGRNHKIFSVFILVMPSLLIACNSVSEPSLNSEPELNSVAITEIVGKPSDGQQIWPKLAIEVKKNQVLEAKVLALLNNMTLEQKVAQMIQPEIRDITLEDMRKYGFGSFLNGGGAFPNNDKHATPADWINLAEDMYQASVDDSLDGSTIPTMWGTDAVHGHNNVIGATLFPHNIGLGAMNNPQLIEKIAAITAKEVMVTGIDWVFAPTVAVVRDDRWGRTYEGYSEDPEIVRSYAAAIVKGLQGRADADFLGDHRVISTVKHFLGDGGTQSGDDQGDTVLSEQELFNLHGQGYITGLTAGAQSVMASFNSWNGKKNHGNKYLLTEVLKDRMGFDGFVVGDWNGHGQVKGCTNESCPQAINAGLDIFMVPTKAWKPLYENTIAQVKSREIEISRIDDAVSRILRVKFRAGIFDKPSPAKRVLSGKTKLIGDQNHRKVAKQAVRESLVLLKNKNSILPIRPHQNILVAGDGADNIGKQSGGWTVTWQGSGNQNSDFPGASSIYDGIYKIMASQQGTVQYSATGEFNEKPDLAIVVFGEEPYAEGNGDIDNLAYQRENKRDLALLKKLKSQDIAVVSIFISGRALWVNAELNASDAFVAAWLPGSEGDGIAEVLFAKNSGEVNYDFKGKLAYSWPNSPTQTNINRYDQSYQPLLPYGFGLTYSDKNLLADNLSELFTLDQTLTSKAIFARSLKQPWQFYISDKANVTRQMNSSFVDNAQLAVRTVDRHIQEDARQFVFSGQGKGKVSISSNFSEDMRAYSQNSAALVFDVKVDSDILSNRDSDIELTMDCQPECKASLNITPQLAHLAKAQWHTMSIDLSCFSEQGADIAKIFTPFSLSTASKLSISVSDIKLVPNMARESLIVCQ